MVRSNPAGFPNESDAADAVESAFVTALVAHQRRIYADLAALVPAPSDVEDVYQQTCLALWRKREQYDPGRAFFPWACSFARNEVFKYVKASRAFRVHLPDELLETLATEQAAADTLAEARRQALDACLAKLQPRQRTLLERCYQGLETIKAVAAEMSISPAALTMRLQRIRHTVVRCVEKTIRASEGAG
ncbi:MAG: sigma-70 family RNA polymerase sigma factor [Pirellulales bacterium]